MQKTTFVFMPSVKIPRWCVVLLFIGASFLPASWADAASNLPSDSPENGVSNSASAPSSMPIGSDLNDPSVDLLAGMQAEGDGLSLSDSLTTMVRVLLALVAILLLAYILLHRGLGALSGRLSKGRIIRVVDRVGLEPRKALYVVEVAGAYFLVGTTDHGVSCLSTLSEPESQGAFNSALKRDARIVSQKQPDVVESTGGQDA